MRQRVVGAIGISSTPSVIIADEPTTSLDVTIQAAYLRLLKQLQAEDGVAIIFITHDFGIVAKMCDRVAVMYAGRIVEQGDVRQIFNTPRHPYTQALIESVPKLEVKTGRLRQIEGQPPLLYNLPAGCPFAPRCPNAIDKCREEYPALRTGFRKPPFPLLEPGDTVMTSTAEPVLSTETAPAVIPDAPGAVTSGDAIVQIRDLKKHFPIGGGFLGLGGRRQWLKAIDGISFDIEPGQTFGLVGESGCGKTTTAKVLLGLERPTDGTIFFEGHDVNNLTREGRKEFRKSIQAVFQDPWSSLNPRMRVMSIVAEPLEIATTMTRQQIRSRVSELLTEVGLNPYQANLYPHEFSGGQRQRIGIARALALNPRVIVLDEPVSALRRLDSRADHEPARGPTGPVRARLPADRAQPGYGPVHVPQGRRHVPGSHQGDRRHGRRVHRSAAPVHHGVDFGRAAVTPRHPAGRDHSPR